MSKLSEIPDALKLRMEGEIMALEFLNQNSGDKLYRYGDTKHRIRNSL